MMDSVHPFMLYRKRGKSSKPGTFSMTPSEKTSVTKIKMKFRGGGGSDEEMYKTPTKPKIRGTVTGSFSKANRGNITKTSPIRTQRRHSLTNQLPPPRSAGYSSDDTPNASYMHHINAKHKNKRKSFTKNCPSMSNNKSRSPVPIPMGIDIAANLRRATSNDTEDYDQSPSLHVMNKQSKRNSPVSPRSPRNKLKPKRATSPLPAPNKPGGIKYTRSMEGGHDESDEDGFDDDDFNSPEKRYLSPHSSMMASPASSFFSKVKHAANGNTNDDQKQQRQRKQRVAVPMPDTDEDEEEEEAGYGGYGGYSDTSNYTDDTVPSFKRDHKGLYAASKHISHGHSHRKLKQKRSVENQYD